MFFHLFLHFSYPSSAKRFSYRQFEEAPAAPSVEPSAVAEAAAEAQPMRSAKAEWMVERLPPGEASIWTKD